MKMCLNCGYVETEDGIYPFGCDHWSMVDAPDLEVFGEADGQCPQCGATGEDWLEVFCGKRISECRR